MVCVENELKVKDLNNLSKEGTTKPVIITHPNFYNYVLHYNILGDAYR